MRLAANGGTTLADSDRARDQVLARIVPDGDAGGWRLQPLTEHLREVGRRAGAFADIFGSGDWGQVLGLWHDLGKARPAFQRYLADATGYSGPPAGAPPGRVDHSTAGAIHAVDRLGAVGRVAAYVVAGHHAGLADWGSSSGGDAALSVRLGRRELLDDARAADCLPEDILQPPVPTSVPPAGTPESLHLWIRMLYSCLVDADSLDAEQFASPVRHGQRQTWPVLALLETRLDRHVRGLPREGAINAVRRAVRDEVLRHASDPPGFFSLTVPTGGGKTLASLSFALAHARAHGHRRVIYAIPYLSIIEQTADVFREALGDGILEHHSSLDPDARDLRSTLAAENWDAPLVVTTTVQLFESLFAARRGRCRKLHNVARSVIVLDEAQLLPPDFLEPILSMLRGLVDSYGVTVVLCTATQPALAARQGSARAFQGLEGVRELIADPEALASQLERVKVSWPRLLDERWAWDEVAQRLLREPRVLCVVNTRRDARELSARVDGSVHLSALMCGQHRSDVLRRVKSRLADGTDVRLVSTQLVEAGVDLDFPVVYRALAGLDSIAQSAGRCNREGRLDRGRVVVFVPPKPSPIGHLRQAEQATRSLMSSTADPTALLTAEGFRRYFERLYADHELDRAGVLPPLVDEARRIEIDFRSAADRFQMIDDSGTSTVLVPYRNGRRLIRELERHGADRWRLRRLQRYSVVLRAREVESLSRSGGVREVAPGLLAVEATHYDERLGVLVTEAAFDQGLVV